MLVCWGVVACRTIPSDNDGPPAGADHVALYAARARARARIPHTCMHSTVQYELHVPVRNQVAPFENGTARAAIDAEIAENSATKIPN